mmetsp:Transcript_9419/g.27219  ORF Transcript_9419/g.27219 Transcript_9419/m.27219 type:complete len:367 (+) Transcript_9419:95-1195(+)
MWAVQERPPLFCDDVGGGRRAAPCLAAPTLLGPLTTPPLRAFTAATAEASASAAHFDEEPPSPEPLPSSSFFSSFLSSVTDFSALWMRGSLTSTPGNDPSKSCTKSGSLNHFASTASPGFASPPVAPLAAAAPSSAFGASAAAGAASFGASAAAAAAGAGSGSPGWASCMDRSNACRNSSSMSSIPMASAKAMSFGAAPPAAAGAAAGAPEAGASPPAAPPAGAAPPSAAGWFADCLARSSSMEIRRASANSGSSVGLMPNSKPSPPAPPPKAPPSPSLRIGEERSTSLNNFGPTGISTMCELSLLFAAANNFCNLALFSSTSPKLTKSRDTLFFFKFLPRVSSSFSVAAIGLPTNAIILCFWFLF